MSVTLFIYFNFFSFENIFLVLFYIFKTKEGHQLSLTGNHIILVYVWEENRTEFIRVSKVTLKHRLIMYGRTIEIESISLNSLVGYYAPLTLTSYLFVNNISTSVFTDRYYFMISFL
jgi:hypothetical protein